MTDALPPVARLSGISHRYGDAVALEAVDLAIPAGVMAGLIGPDGVGKSTILALVSGARQIQAGRVEVLAQDMADARARSAVQPRIAYMPQGLGRNLYPTLSVFENVDFFGRLFGHDKQERARRIADLLRSTGLTPFRDRPAAKLSGGMKQKLGLCCALIHDPDVLILDEPTTGVDPLSRRQFWELIDRIRARRPGMSVLVATAYMEEAERFDWLAALDGGRVIGTGSPAELRARTGSQTLEQAFIALLPEDKRRGHHELVIAPYVETAAEPIIEAVNLTQRFGDFTAVDGVSFRIRQGEIFGFLGSNGCGKTTTMKMLTGLLPPTSGEARLFGKPVAAGDMATRREVGYMSQGFSLYSELTVWQNLELHARLFHLPAEKLLPRVEELLQRFDLQPYRDVTAESLPLGIRQRLSLAVAIVHEPRLLILDEPTSGVDPIARDSFWALLVSLSREQGVTIFISTHFMNEASRCDRISLMHAGKVLASDTPKALMGSMGQPTLEAAFIAALEQAAGPQEAPPEDEAPAAAEVPSGPPPVFSLQRLLGYAYRELVELRRDAVRLTFALLGSVVLMFVLGKGISMDVDGLKFAALDQDQTPESRDYIQNIAGSRYFIQQPALTSVVDLERRMKGGEISLAVVIPPNYGRDLRRNRVPEVGLWVDGSAPYRGETILGYARGMHQQYILRLVTEATGNEPKLLAADIEPRYRYNQDFRSIYAMVPAVIPLLLIFIPAILIALGVVREKELGSITNLYVTPVTKLEFLLGKQLPYVGLAMISYFGLVAEALVVFGVPINGSFAALTLGAFLYVVSTTSLGLFMSTFTRTQIAALFGTAILTMLPTVQFSGLTTPVSSLEGMGYWLGKGFPAGYFLTISRGAFTKALGFADLQGQFVALACFPPVLTLLSWLLLRKQEK